MSNRGDAAIHFTIRAGSNRVDSGGQIIPVIRVIEHELNTDPYDWSFEYDIAILKLRRNLVFSASVRAIQLPAQGFNVPHGSIATITGWAIFMDNWDYDWEASVLESTNTTIIENA